MARWRKRRRGQGGFTMIEVLITMLLLTVVLMGLAALQITTIRQVTLSKRANGALRLGQAIIERYQTKGFAYLPTTSSPSQTWEPVLKKDQTTPMILVAEDGESDGPFTVQQLIEIIGVSGGTGANDVLITVRVTWLDVIQNNAATSSDKYRTLEVLLTIRRTQV